MTPLSSILYHSHREATLGGAAQITRSLLGLGGGPVSICTFRMRCSAVQCRECFCFSMLFPRLRGAFGFCSTMPVRRTSIYPLIIDSRTTTFRCAYRTSSKKARKVGP